MNRTWEDFKDFHFNNFVYELYLFQFSDKQRQAVDDETSEAYKKMMIAAGKVFEMHAPALRLKWELMKHVGGEIIDHNREVNDMIGELDQFIRRKNVA